MWPWTGSEQEKNKEKEVKAEMESMKMARQINTERNKQISYPFWVSIAPSTEPGKQSMLSKE